MYFSPPSHKDCVSETSGQQILDAVCLFWSKGICFEEIAGPPTELRADTAP
jgi:hypothetical protein